MNPFSSISEMIQTHEAMWGAAGRFCAEAVCRHVTLFDKSLDPLRIRIALAPDEIGPYNRHAGFTNSKAEISNIILGNRHVCHLVSDGSVVLNDLQWAEDFLVHELTHHRQHALLVRHGWPQSRSR